MDKRLSTETLRKEIRAILISANRAGLSAIDIDRDYRSMMGSPIPYRALGFRSLEELFAAMPDVVRQSSNAAGLAVYTGVADENVCHIASLIARTKGKDRRGGRRSGRGYFGATYRPSWPARPNSDRRPPPLLSLPIRSHPCRTPMQGPTAQRSGPLPPPQSSNQLRDSVDQQPVTTPATSKPQESRTPVPLRLSIASATPAVQNTSQMNKCQVNAFQANVSQANKSQVKSTTTWSLNRPDICPSQPPPPPNPADNILRGQIKQLLWAYQSGLPMEGPNGFAEAYAKRFGHFLNLREKGFRSFEDLILWMPDVAEIIKSPGGELLVLPCCRLKNKRPTGADGSKDYGVLVAQSTTGRQTSGIEDCETFSNDSVDETGFSRRLKRLIQTVLSQHPNGLAASKLVAEFKNITGYELPLQRYGYRDVVSFICEMEDIVSRSRPTSGDWLFFDKRSYTGPTAADTDNANLTSGRNVKALLEDFRCILEEILQSQPDGVLLDDLPQAIENVIERRFDPQELGFRRIDALLHSLCDLVTLRYVGQGRCMVELCKQARTSSPTAAVAERQSLVNNTMVTSGNDGGCGGRSIPSDAVGAGCEYTIQDCPEVSAKYWPVHVTNVLSPGEFCIALADRMDDLEDIMNGLQEFYNHASASPYRLPPSFHQIGQVCVARYHACGEWHRCTLISFKMDQAKLLYVDYGSTGYQPLDQVYLLRRKFFNLSAQAIHARLAHIQPINGAQWAAAAYTYFMKLVENRRLLAMVTHLNSARGVVSLILCDTTQKKDIFINDCMMSEGHAQQKFDEFEQMQTTEDEEDGEEEDEEDEGIIETIDRVNEILDNEKRPLSSHSYYNGQQQRDSYYIGQHDNNYRQRMGGAGHGYLPSDEVKPRVTPWLSMDHGTEQTTSCYIRPVQLTRDYLVHLIRVDDKLYVISTEVSALLWPDDCVRTKLRHIGKTNLSRLVLSREERRDLFHQLIRAGIPGAKADNDDSILVIYELSSVVEILELFSHPSEELKISVQRQIDMFNPRDAFWMGVDDNERSEEENEYDDGEFFDEELTDLCDQLDILREQRMSLLEQLKSTKGMEVARLVDTLDENDAWVKDIQQRIDELTRDNGLEPLYAENLTTSSHPNIASNQATRAPQPIDPNLSTNQPANQSSTIDQPFKQNNSTNQMTASERETGRLQLTPIKSTISRTHSPLATSSTIQQLPTLGDRLSSSHQAPSIQQAASIQQTVLSSVPQQPTLRDRLSISHQAPNTQQAPNTLQSPTVLGIRTVHQQSTLPDHISLTYSTSDVHQTPLISSSIMAATALTMSQQPGVAHASKPSDGTTMSMGLPTASAQATTVSVPASITASVGILPSARQASQLILGRSTINGTGTPDPKVAKIIASIPINYRHFPKEIRLKAQSLEQSSVLATLTGPLSASTVLITTSTGLMTTSTGLVTTSARPLTASTGPVHVNGQLVSSGLALNGPSNGNFSSGLVSSGQVSSGLTSNGPNSCGLTTSSLFSSRLTSNSLNPPGLISSGQLAFSPHSSGLTSNVPSFSSGCTSNGPFPPGLILNGPLASNGPNGLGMSFSGQLAPLGYVGQPLQLQLAQQYMQPVYQTMSFNSMNRAMPTALLNSNINNNEGVAVRGLNSSYGGYQYQPHQYPPRMQSIPGGQDLYAYVRPMNIAPPGYAGLSYIPPAECNVAPSQFATLSRPPGIFNGISLGAVSYGTMSSAAISYGAMSSGAMSSCAVTSGAMSYASKTGEECVTTGQRGFGVDTRSGLQGLNVESVGETTAGIVGQCTADFSSSILSMSDLEGLI